VRPAYRLFYAQEKAELEQLLDEEVASGRKIDLYLLRPPVVLGPHAVGAKTQLPQAVSDALAATLGLAQRLPVPIPVPAANVPMQFIHEEDVGQALLKCDLAEGPPGAYNIAGDGVVSGADVVRELGLAPIGIPASAVYTAARAVSQLPWPSFMPPAAEWVEALSHPAIMDTSKAREQLGWEPRYSSLDALRETLAAARR
jgi:nucleoside-diphosphate-sugar epimerase